MGFFGARSAQHKQAQFLSEVLQMPDHWISAQNIDDDWECACKKYVGYNYRSITCERCGATVGELKKNRQWFTLTIFCGITAEHLASMLMGNEEGKQLREMLFVVFPELVTARLGAPVPWSSYLRSEETAAIIPKLPISEQIASLYQGRSTVLVPLITSADFILTGAELSIQCGYGHEETIEMSTFVGVAQTEILKSLGRNRWKKTPR